MESVALNRIGEELSALKSIITTAADSQIKIANQGLALAATAADTSLPSFKAEELLQKTEGDSLDFSATLALVDHFVMDPNAAELYLGLQSPALRKFWARRELNKMGLGDLVHGEKSEREAASPSS
jgi:hypothetical protein